MTRKLVFTCALVLFAASAYATEERPERPVPEAEQIESKESEGEESRPKNLALSPMNRSVEGLEATAAAHGATKVDLEGRFQHALVLRIAPDGTRSIECIDSAEHEAELLNIESPASSPGDDKED